MRFLAFPAAALGFLILWSSGLSFGTSLVLGPTLALFLTGILLPLLWPAPPRKKKGPYVRIERPESRRTPPRS
jgi:hypothetical protein